MREVKNDSSRKIFFHCTVGEDRTGYLAGLWKMLSDNVSRNEAFHNEMCINGYGAGNPIKPDYVVNEIRQDLTPMFTYMAYLIDKNLVSLANLTKRYCTNNISLEVRLLCHASERFPYSSIKR